MMEIICLAAFVLAMFSLGTALLKIFRVDFLNYWEKAVFAQAIALFALVYITFAFGIAEFLYYANENLPDNAKLCLYGESEGFYSEHDYVWCHPTHQGYVDFYTISLEEQLVSRLKEIGVTHLLMENSINDWRKLYAENNLGAAVKATDNAEALFDEVIKDYGVLVFENDNGRLFKIVY